MKFNFFFVLCVICALISHNMISCDSKNRKAKNKAAQDDDEFAEFDQAFDDDDVGQPQRKQQQQTNKQQQQQQETVAKTQQQNTQKESDFSEFDANVEIENEDDEEFESIIEDKKQQDVTQKPPTTDTKSGAKKPTQQQQQQQQSNTKHKFQDEQLDSEEFEAFSDDEEFEVDQNDAKSDQQQQSKKSSDSNKIPNLKITNVPEHLLSTGNWTSYYWEIIMCAGILVYVINVFIGKSKNYQIANAWFQSNREVLEKNFALVGDDGGSTELPAESTLLKECDHIYDIWCSGRSTCKSMFVQLKLVKRQDLISVISKLFKPVCDQIYISVEFDRTVMDNYVFCLANKKISSYLTNNYSDLSKYCEKKKQISDKYGVESKYVLINEFGEVADYLLDKALAPFLVKYPDLIEFIHISDQFTGMKSIQEDQNSQQQVKQQNLDDIGLPNAISMMVICLNIPGKGNSTISDIEKMNVATDFAIKLCDKVAFFKLSKEAKAKALKQRKKVTEEFLKVSNKQRQEEDQLRKEEKRRADKEKMMNESDPEKQKRLEEKQLKKEAKRNQPKLKQVKIKSM